MNAGFWVFISFQKIRFGFLFFRGKWLIFFFGFEFKHFWIVFLSREVSFFLNIILETNISNKFLIVKFSLESRSFVVLFWSDSIEIKSKVFCFNFRQPSNTDFLPRRLFFYRLFLGWRWIPYGFLRTLGLIAAGFSFVKGHFYKLWSRIIHCDVCDFFLNYNGAFQEIICTIRRSADEFGSILHEEDWIIYKSQDGSIHLIPKQKFLVLDIKCSYRIVCKLYEHLIYLFKKIHSENLRQNFIILLNYYKSIVKNLLTAMRSL